ncbi:Sec1-like protein [Dillenia turbinata]|uniref:Sec1-like protein n=1 Tax=Dillenia turbinata TaxID=194707 RepID=A0AAN8UUW8_9MAGN
MADITDEGISLVEDLFRRRQPMPMDAIYFIQPSKENLVLLQMSSLIFMLCTSIISIKLLQALWALCSIIMFMSDMSGREPLYKKAYVFFSSPIPKDLVDRIKSDTSLLPRIGALREMNLEYFSIDSQAYITDQERALDELYGESAEKSHAFVQCIGTMASRISTVFASLKEFPYVRYRAAKTPDESTAATFRDSVPTKLAAAVWECVSKYKSTIQNFPQTETCELLILDRSVDLIAPVIHEWTYDAMCHDLLDMDGNKYVHEVPSKTGGNPERKEVLLEDHDPVWLELRHAHIADASERLHDKMTNFKSKNKAAQLSSRDGSELSTRDLQKMVQALPQYTEQVEKLSLHVEIASKINTLIGETRLRDLGQLEQDIVFGDAGTKELINFLRSRQDASVENKLRLLMIYASVNPDKFEGDKGTKLMQLAKLSLEDMKVINNMRLLEGSPQSKKKTSGNFSLKFDGQKRKNAARKDRTDEEETWQLFRFYPMLEELLEKLGKGELPKDEYHCMNGPSSTVQPSTATTQGSSARTNQSSAPQSAPHSIRSRRTATWAKSRTSDDGISSDSTLKNATTEFKKMGQRIFVFIIGGATRSELRVCHKLSAKLKREVVLGTSSLDDPPRYITKLKLLSETDLSVDRMQIY